jgi:hypothetical protein
MTAVDEEASPENARVHFAPFTKQDVLDVVIDRGILFPSGVTRYLITCGRILHVDVPLTLLRSPCSLAEKMHEFHRHLATRHRRLYEEPTIQYEG